MVTARKADVRKNAAAQRYQFCYILLESGQALVNVFQNEHGLLEFDGDLGSYGLRGGSANGTLGSPGVAGLSAPRTRRGPRGSPLSLRLQRVSQRSTREPGTAASLQSGRTGTGLRAATGLRKTPEAVDSRHGFPPEQWALVGIIRPRAQSFSLGDRSILQFRAL
ncbi:hypothetical protein HPB47_009205 [Ixodes persulcatus]|uniref:Uncharacterized protein n=1 Tax=Ixodes persulcatus TaxID=34615 RepID=A0AC60P2N5_IXOPE|nr:hypothetical protein HPB47_009205 [Ixodes persulcatus]